mmetsp:Transcript_51707/g.110475  ORF Transcript_51707/g.110475 Transcript_51707/m.110475 type:complete len:214 (-) Transcript_51707:1048-1689(-)
MPEWLWGGDDEGGGDGVGDELGGGGVGGGGVVGAGEGGGCEGWEPPNQTFRNCCLVFASQYSILSFNDGAVAPSAPAPARATSSAHRDCSSVGERVGVGRYDIAKRLRASRSTHGCRSAFVMMLIPMWMPTRARTSNFSPYTSCAGPSSSLSALCEITMSHTSGGSALKSSTPAQACGAVQPSSPRYRRCSIVVCSRSYVRYRAPDLLEPPCL